MANIRPFGTNVNTSISFKDDISRNLATCFVTLEIYWYTPAEISDCLSISFLSPFLQRSFRTSMIPRSCFCQITLKVMRRATSLTLHRMPSTTLLLTSGCGNPPLSPAGQVCQPQVGKTGKSLLISLSSLLPASSIYLW